MKRHALSCVLIVLLCICFIFQYTYAQEENHQIEMPLEPEVATPGTSFSWPFDITQGTEGSNADMYAVLLTPDGYFFSLLPYGITDALVPYMVDWSVSDMSSSFLSDLVLPSVLPSGNWLFGSLLVQSLSDPLDFNNWVSNLAVSTLYFSLLSPAQQAFINEIGYPDLFIKTFDDDNGQVRVDETWVYIDEGLTEYFINGAFVEEETLDSSSGTIQAFQYHPEDYNFDTTSQAIISRHGQPAEITIDVPSAGEFFDNFQADTYYIYSDIIFGFKNGKLVFVIPNQ